MDDYKALLQSKTVWSGILTFAASILAIFGYTIAPEQIAELTNFALTFVTAVTGLLTIFYRVKATKKIGGE